MPTSSVFGTTTERREQNQWSCFFNSFSGLIWVGCWWGRGSGRRLHFRGRSGMFFSSLFYFLLLISSTFQFDSKYVCLYAIGYSKTWSFFSFSSSFYLSEADFTDGSGLSLSIFRKLSLCFRPVQGHRFNYSRFKKDIREGKTFDLFLSDFRFMAYCTFTVSKNISQPDTDPKRLQDIPDPSYP